jgi:protein-S-isoprenylcysteine O-methyltransferase Ste14
MTLDTPRAARPNIIPWPVVIWLFAIVGGLALGHAAPLPWFPSGPPASAAWGLGVVVIAVAIVIDIYAVMTFRRHDTTPMPHKAATALITDGPFAYSRNPLYVSHTILTIGIGLVAGSLWLFLFAALAVVAAQKLAVEREEMHLAARFGAAWQDYAASVPRWLW